MKSKSCHIHIYLYMSRYNSRSDFSVGLLCNIAPIAFTMKAESATYAGCHTDEAGDPVELHECKPIR